MPHSTARGRPTLAGPRRSGPGDGAARLEGRDDEAADAPAHRAKPRGVAEPGLPASPAPRRISRPAASPRPRRTRPSRPHGGSRCPPGSPARTDRFRWRRRPAGRPAERRCPPRRSRGYPGPGTPAIRRCAPGPPSSASTGPGRCSAPGAGAAARPAIAGRRTGTAGRGTRTRAPRLRRRRARRREGRPRPIAPDRSQSAHRILSPILGKKSNSTQTVQKNVLRGARMRSISPILGTTSGPLLAYRFVA